MLTPAQEKEKVKTIIAGCKHKGQEGLIDFIHAFPRDEPAQERLRSPQIARQHDRRDNDVLELRLSTRAPQRKDSTPW